MYEHKKYLHGLVIHPLDFIQTVLWPMCWSMTLRPHLPLVTLLLKEVRNTDEICESVRREKFQKNDLNFLKKAAV